MVPVKRQINWNLLHCWWERKTEQPLWETVWQFLKKLNIKSLPDPAIPFLGIYPEDPNAGVP